MTKSSKNEQHSKKKKRKKFIDIWQEAPKGSPRGEKGLRFELCLGAK